MGCFRTFSDMQAWRKATYEEKTMILDEAKKRKSEHFSRINKKNES